MTNPYSVPMEDLDAVHVSGDHLVQAQDEALRWAGGGATAHPYGDGPGTDADGE